MYLYMLSLAMHSTVSGHYFCDNYHFSRLFQLFLYILLKYACFNFSQIQFVFLAIQGQKTEAIGMVTD